MQPFRFQVGKKKRGGKKREREGPIPLSVGKLSKDSPRDQILATRSNPLFLLGYPNSLRVYRSEDNEADAAVLQNILYRSVITPLPYWVTIAAAAVAVAVATGDSNQILYSREHTRYTNWRPFLPKWPFTLGATNGGCKCVVNSCKNKSCSRLVITTLKWILPSSLFYFFLFFVLQTTVKFSVLLHKRDSPQFPELWASCDLRVSSCRPCASSNNSRRAGSGPSCASRAASSRSLV